MATSPQPVAQPERKRRRIVLPGGSGNIGELLAKHFHAQGDDVVVLSRRPRAAPWTVLPWDGQTEGAWVDTVDGADAVIHLSGRTVNTRSTARHRREIYDSRIVPTRLLNTVIRGLRNPPPVWLNASTATIYKHAFDEPQEEADCEIGGYEPNVPKSWAFSVKVGLDWEAALDANAMPHTRRVALRTSLVMSPQPGSVFAVLSRLARLGLGGTQGKGTQRVSWIHAEDYVRAIERVLEHPQYNDIVNLSAPDAPVNRDFMRIL